MVEENTPQAIQRPESAVPKMLAVAAVMLVVAVAVNWKSIKQVAKGDRTVAQIIEGRRPTTGMDGMGHSGEPFNFPEPSGPEDAKVTVWVGAHENDGCQKPLVDLWASIGELEPERIRVEYYNPFELPQVDGQPVELGCESGAVVNGKIKFELGEGEEARVIYTTGPPGIHDWTSAHLAEVLNGEVEAAYGEPGTLTGEAIEKAMHEAGAAIPATEEMIEAAVGGGSGGEAPAAEPTAHDVEPPAEEGEKDQDSGVEE